MSSSALGQPAGAGMERAGLETTCCADLGEDLAPIRRFERSSRHQLHLRARTGTRHEYWEEQEDCTRDHD
eukprot:1422293-Rhodomonas_salina.1